ncbi:MAG: molybdate ABC transporter substrate-binding protein [Myxococcota bacterium]
MVGLLGAGACGDRSQTVLTVLAASSLTDAFGVLERRFEGEHPGTDVVMIHAGSQVLRVQLEHGAPGDVFASANAEHMQAVMAAGRVAQEHPFARGGLALVVPPDNPAGIESLEQLPRASRVVLGVPEVPVGRYTQALLEQADRYYNNHSGLQGGGLQGGSLQGGSFRAQVQERVVSLEPNVRLVLAKVELGEADAAIVYRSDVTSARAVTMIPIPASLDVAAEYHVGILVDSEHPHVARQWVELLGSSPGQAVLQEHGFVSLDDR